MRHVDSTGWCQVEPSGFLAQYGLGPNLLSVWDPSRWHMATLCRLSVSAFEMPCHENLRVSRHG
jgi:hypothetical protein